MSTSVGAKPSLNAAARSTVVVVTGIGPEYTSPLVAVGAVRSVVYRMVAPGVAVVISTMMLVS